MSLPPSSPRLPSPPPPTEIQIGPKSPSMGDAGSSQESLIEQSILKANSSRRIHPGTKAADMAAGPPLVPLMEVRNSQSCLPYVNTDKSQLDSAFQLQEHLKALHYHYTRPSPSHTIPIDRHTAALIATPPSGVDRALWLYELCRFLINKCNDLIVGFLFDSPPCSASTCPEMRASEWQFLCAVHESPKSCCAIDYCCHTLDWATNTVTSQKIFPSRLSLKSGDSLEDNNTGVRHLTNIFRRLHRIFAHAWFQHRGVFWQVEGQTGLYVLFKTVCDNYELLPAENYKLPPEAEGLEPVVEQKVPSHTILKPEGAPLNKSSADGEEDQSFTAVSRTNTRRHIRSSPSTGAAVTTVLEADEDESNMAHRLRVLQIREQEIVQEIEEEESQAHDEGGALPEIEILTEEETEMTILVDNNTDNAVVNESKPTAASERPLTDLEPSEGAVQEEGRADEDVQGSNSQAESEEKAKGVDGVKDTPVHTLNLDEQSPVDEKEPNSV